MDIKDFQEFFDEEEGRRPMKDVRKAMDLEKKLTILKLIELYESRQEISGTSKWFQPNTPFSLDNCPKHKAFFAAGKLYRQRLFMAGNRCGKTIAGAYETGLHATGLYPTYWPGRIFKRPTSIWVAGKTGQTTRDTVQKELMGPPGQIGTGMIPAERIKKITMRPGVPNGIDTVEVWHESGGVSTIGFKSFDQRMESFYGTAKHVVWLDEECPELIYNECLWRTTQLRDEPGGGIIYMTFTPLQGLTPLILNFDKDADHPDGSSHIMAQVEEISHAGRK